MALLNCTVKSGVLGMNVPLTVVLPFEDPANSRENCSVLYLLHGLSDAHDAWHRYTSAERYARNNNMVLVMPTVYRNFYTNMEYGGRFFDYVADELPEIIKMLFGLTFPKERTFVAGNSMGGYGTLKLAMRRPEKIGACAAFSAVTDIEKIYSEHTLMSEREYLSIFGESVKPEDNLFSLAEEVAKTSPENRPKIYMACGFNDFLYDHNVRFDGKLTELGIAHTYEEWEGVHDWFFWDTALPKAMEFFKNSK